MNWRWLTQLSFSLVVLYEESGPSVHHMVHLSRERKERFCSDQGTDEKRDRRGATLCLQTALGKAYICSQTTSLSSLYPESQHCYPDCFVTCWEFFTFLSNLTILQFALLSPPMDALSYQGSSCLAAPSSRLCPSGTIG